MNSVSESQLSLLKRQFEHALNHRRTLLDTLASHAPAQAQLQQLPLWLQTRPLEKIEQIVPEQIAGIDAHPALISALNDLYRRDDDLQSQKVRRYPGLVRFAAVQQQSLIADAQQLQQSLAEFKEHLHQATAPYSNKQDLRFELLHQFAPNLITMHFYRAPVMLAAEVRRVRFAWVGKRIIAKTTKAEILQRLENSLVHPGKLIHDIPAWNRCVSDEIRAIQSLPANVELRIDRPGGLRPTAFVQYTDGRRWQTPANLPLLCAQDAPIEVVSLPNWQQKAFPEAKGEQLIPRLHLYRIN
ncbi:DNA replication terminus site-binding protein [Ferrimonas senticii]|uniref:DNA replication terminus site-binding protein n=1 Tax=Ferrimonas senticii TaxID=394566 RepID=UPI000424D1FF|nr:DNA replication terminus site-binding protein [Ferrimonas senticii]